MTEEKSVHEILHDIRNGLSMISPLILFTSEKRTEYRIDNITRQSKNAQEGMNRVMFALEELDRIYYSNKG